jgi:CRISPR-associated protein Csb2
MISDSSDCVSINIAEKYHTDDLRCLNLATSRSVEALIWRVNPDLPLLADHLLFTDALRGACISTIRDNVPAQITGHDSSGNPRSGHHHGHYLALPSSDNMHIERFVAWFPQGLSIYHVAVLSDIKKLFVRQKGSGLGEASISLDRTGELELLLPSMTGPSTEWHSIVPFVPSRHIHKKERLHSFVESNLMHELHERDIHSDIVDVFWRPAWSVPALRSESSNHWFRSYHIGITLSCAVKGPLILGRHAHFGYGLFGCGGT